MPSVPIIVLLVIIAAQLLWIYLAHRRAQRRDELFRIITENAADMIALVDTKGHRLYNSPAYKRILGYSPAELAQTSVFEQIHPDDRFKVLEAAREARSTGVGKSLQYRLRHKDGSWRILESTASTIRNKDGEVEKLVIVNRDVTDRVHAEEQLAHNALHDSLTNLPNRRLFLDRLQRCHSQAQRDPNFRYALLLADLDSFKTLNHTLGSATGDQVLIEVAHRLEACLRHTDTLSRSDTGDLILSRTGGDDFALLLEACSDPSDVLRIADRIQTAVAAPLLLPHGEVSLTVSIGIALSSPEQQRPEDILRDAETALRRAQAMAGHRSELFDPALHNRAVGRLKLESDLRAALNHGQFRVFFQPVFQIAPRQLVGFEALIRWLHPDQGLISPSAFLDAAEDTGLMSLIDQWVIREACRHLPLLQSASASSARLHLAVNLCARHFSSPQLLDDIHACLREARVPPGTLQLGITHATAMGDPDRTASTFAQLRRLEVSTAIDNFAASDISLSALRRITPDVLKIDRLLIATMQSDRAAHDVLSLVLSLARTLSRRVVAQGVETVAQLDHLQALGCDLAQGYLFSPPRDSESIQQFLRQQARSVPSPVSAAACN